MRSSLNCCSGAVSCFFATQRFLRTVSANVVNDNYLIEAELATNCETGPEQAMEVSGKAQRSTMSRALRVKTPAMQVPAASQIQKLALSDLEWHLGYFVRRLQVEIFTDFIRTLAPLNVRPAQYSVLVLVEANPGRSQAVIGKALNIERARLARLLHDLERRDWIERRAAAGDGRSHSLFLTAAGEKALFQIKRLAKQHEDHMTKLVGTDRRTALMKLLKEFG